LACDVNALNANCGLFCFLTFRYEFNVKYPLAFFKLRRNIQEGLWFWIWKLDWRWNLHF